MTRLRWNPGARVPLLPLVAIGFCCVGLVTAFIGLREVVGSESNAKLWLVLFVAAGVAALVPLRTARDNRARMRLGIGWFALGLVVVATIITLTPSPGPGAPLASGWAVLVAGGSAVLVGGVLLAVSPLVPVRTNRQVVALAVITVCAIQIGGYAVAVGWTAGQNVTMTGADTGPLATRQSELDGQVQWSGKSSGTQVASAGGVLTVSADGLVMLDPATGKPRWTYGRADAARFSDLVVSSDGTLVGAIALMSEGNSTAQQGQRLLVLNAVTGTLVADPLLGTRSIGPLIALDSIDAVFVGAPGNVGASQVAAVALTGPKAGQQEWRYRSNDRCEIHAVSTLGSEVALSSTCGTIAMLNADGTPRWTYRSPTGGAEIWPLAGSPANTVQVVTAPAPIQDTPSGHVSGPSGVISLDARTGALRWQDNNLPGIPFLPDSQDAVIGSMATMWSGDTAVLVYDLLSSPEVWLVGYRRGASPSTWSTVVPNLAYPIDAPQTLSQHVVAEPDGKILLSTQDIESANDLNAHPGVTVVNARDGKITSKVTFGGPHGITGSTGFLGAPVVLSTPGGVVLSVSGGSEVTGAEVRGRAGLNEGGGSTVLVGLH